MAYYVGDKGPKSVPFVIDTGDVDGTDAASARVIVYKPDGTQAEWTPSALTTSEDEVSFSVTLQSNGSSLPSVGQYYARVWLYDSGGVNILDTDEQLLFTVRAARLTWPV